MKKAFESFIPVNPTPLCYPQKLHSSFSNSQKVMYFFPSDERSKEFYKSLFSGLFFFLIP